MKDYIINNSNLLSYDNIVKLSIQTTENNKQIFSSKQLFFSIYFSESTNIKK